MSRYVCRPWGEVLMSKRSSAYSNMGTCMLLRVGGEPSTAEIRGSNRSMNMPNSKGLRGQPCYTPKSQGKEALRP